MKYFTIEELCQSTTADRKGIDNRCSNEIAANLTALVDKGQEHYQPMQSE